MPTTTSTDQRAHQLCNCEHDPPNDNTTICGIRPPSSGDALVDWDGERSRCPPVPVCGTKLSCPACRSARTSLTAPAVALGHLRPLRATPPYPPRRVPRVAPDVPVEYPATSEEHQPVAPRLMGHSEPRALVRPGRDSAAVSRRGRGGVTARSKGADGLGPIDQRTAHPPRAARNPWGGHLDDRPPPVTYPPNAAGGVRFWWEGGRYRRPAACPHDGGVAGGGGGGTGGGYRVEAIFASDRGPKPTTPERVNHLHNPPHLTQTEHQVRRAESSRLRAVGKVQAQRLKHLRWGLLRRGSRIRGRVRQRVHALLTSKMATARAWELKETFFDFWKYKSVLWGGEPFSTTGPSGLCAAVWNR